MTRIKGYLTMDEMAREMDIPYLAALGLAKWLGFRKLGKLYLISQVEFNTITSALGDLSILLTDIRVREGD